MNVFVTGCCGYIGSHTAVELLERGHSVVGLDNFSNSKPSVLDGIKEITGKSVKFYEGDMLDRAILDKIFEENAIDTVIDFAAYKSVGESVSKPVEYYINNVSSVLTLVSAMSAHGVKSLIFSSTAAVYGEPETVPITENCKVGDTANPYGRSKLYVEGILRDLYESDKDWNICVFRYFNVVGAHKSGIIGEEPNGIPANLMPYIVKVAAGELPQLNVFGDDYDTPDGTGVRDYIHVVDLAKAHVSAAEKLCSEHKGFAIYNLGTGTGYSVLEMVRAFERVNGVKVGYQITDRRAGDIGACYADPSKAGRELGWHAELGIEDMCADSYNFIRKRTDS
ncbi:MAG: UDP-glucose 4-epimerase GalE [Oscillospiraceae bacterium]|nr:UDP-glucose 4-epimerase GalE [Oscillospiraceae bacterium]